MIRIFLTAAVIALAIAAPPAYAQISAPGQGSAHTAAAAGYKSKSEPLAPALPGAATQTDRVTPSDRPADDLDPTSALFDGVNRGDIAAVRAAINRGADVGSRNQLGLSALDVAVDLGRNDITFLLLSYRGMMEPGAQPRPGRAAARPAGRAGRYAARRAPDEGDFAAEPAGRAGAAAKEVDTRPARTAKLYANDGGAAIPAAGFLGFDSGRR
jgi:hypothetical protein